MKTGTFFTRLITAVFVTLTLSCGTSDIADLLLNKMVFEELTIYFNGTRVTDDKGINFGLVEPQSNTSGSLVFKNNTKEDIIINNVSTSETYPFSFLIPAIQYPLTIPGGHSFPFAISFSPGTAPKSATMTISSTDSLNPERIIPLTGRTRMWKIISINELPTLVTFPSMQIVGSEIYVAYISGDVNYRPYLYNVSAKSNIELSQDDHNSTNKTYTAKYNDVMYSGFTSSIKRPVVYKGTSQITGDLVDNISRADMTVVNGTIYLFVNSLTFNDLYSTSEMAWVTNPMETINDAGLPSICSVGSSLLLGFNLTLNPKGYHISRYLPGSGEQSRSQITTNVVNYGQVRSDSQGNVFSAYMEFTNIISFRRLNVTAWEVLSQTITVSDAVNNDLAVNNGVPYLAYLSSGKVSVSYFDETINGFKTLGGPYSPSYPELASQPSIAFDSKGVLHLALRDDYGKLVILKYE
jgi:hypothetical protein